MGAKGRRLPLDGTRCASSTVAKWDATFKLTDRQSQYGVNEKMYGIGPPDSAFFSARDRVRPPAPCTLSHRLLHKLNIQPGIREYTIVT